MSKTLIAQMIRGDKSALLAGLSHSGAIYRANAIAFSVLSEATDMEIIALIKSLKEDHIILFGYRVSDFALAALDLLGIEAYSGDRDFVKKLIESKFDFME